MPLWLPVLLMVMTIGAWSAWNIFTDYRNIVEREYRLLEVRARQREARISGSLRSVNLMLGSIIEDLADRPNLSTAERNTLLKSYMRQLPEVRNILIVDAKGLIQGDANEKTLGRDASEREYFKVHSAAPGDDRFHVSLPFKAFIGVMATTMSRVIRDDQKRFAGVVLASLDSASFNEALKISVNEPGVAALLINQRGDILSMIPATAFIGKNLQGGIAYTEHVNSHESTTRHLNNSKFGSTVKLSVFHNLPEAPLTVIVSRDRASLMADWRQSLYAHVASFVLLALVTLSLLGLSIRRQRDLARIKEQLAESERELQTIIEASPECVKILAADGALLKMNPAGLQMIEADSWEQVTGRKVDNIIAPAHRQAFAALTRRVCSGGTGQLEFEIIGLKGGHRWLDTHAVPIPNPSGEGMLLLGLTRDITQRKQLEAVQQEARRELELKLEQISELQLRLQEQVIRDPLTGLFNRRFLDETLPRELSRAKREGYSLSLIMLDLDHFKQVNDTYGHSAGDEVLRTLAEILRHNARDSDIICRYGGEEFLVALPRMAPDQARQRVESWRQTLENTVIRHGDLAIKVTLSAGIANYPDHGADVEILFARADQALYQAKQAGRNRVTCFSAQP